MFKNNELKPYRVVIFDLDGTLLDTLEDLGTAVNEALSRQHLPIHPISEYRAKVGHGIRNLVTVSLPEELRADEGLIDTCLADFKAYYTSHIDTLTHPYAGMPELVRELDGRLVRLAIASNKFQEGTEYLVRKFFPGIPFVAILGNREGFPLKPDPAIVREVLEKTGAQPRECVLVGDSPTDMKTAANGGIDGIAVNWGYRSMQGVDTVDALRERLGCC